MTLISLIVCTGCFDLNEYIFLKKDGSGKFSFIIDMSKMMAMSKLLDEGKETKTKDESDQVSSTFDRSKKKIINLPGISNYLEILDTVNYKFGFSFDFKNMESLNKAMNIVFAEDTAAAITNYTYFEFKNNELSRLEPNDVTRLIKGPASTEATSMSGPKNSLFNFDALFSDISYTTQYEFEQAIDSVSNENSLLSANKRKVTLSCHPFAKDSISMACSLKNKIFLK
jgi:hypothetical protein